MGRPKLGPSRAQVGGPKLGPSGWAQAGPRFLEIGKSGVWKSGNLESQKVQKIKILKIKIRVAQNVGKVWISRKKTSWPHLVPFQAIFCVGRKNRKNLEFCLFSLVGQWALFTRFGPMGLVGVPLLLLVVSEASCHGDLPIFMNPAWLCVLHNYTGVKSICRAERCICRSCFLATSTVVGTSYCQD